MGCDCNSLLHKPKVTISSPEGRPVPIDSATDKPSSRLLVPLIDDKQPRAPSEEYISTPGLPDVNIYQQKKTLAQGMMDLALISANATQMRFVLESQAVHPYFYISLFFIALSICFQVAVGIGLMLNCRYNIKKQQHICPANKVNNLTVLGVFIITVINVFVSAFCVYEAPELDRRIVLENGTHPVIVPTY